VKISGEDFAKKQEELLSSFHPILAKALRIKAYEDGHSAGMDEVLIHLAGLVSDFEEVNSILMEAKH
jgi:hypothetical protein